MVMFIPRRIRFVARIAWVAVALALSGCSATKAIEADAALVKREAAAVKEKAIDTSKRAQTIYGLLFMRGDGFPFAKDKPRENADIDFPAVAAELKDIDTNQTFIYTRADTAEQAGQRIDDNADDVKDKGGWFSKVLTILWWAFLIGCGVAVVIVLEKLGLGPILRKLMSWIPWLIPSPTQKKAELAVKVADPHDPAEAEHLIAAMRAQDPVFNAAFERQKRLREAKQARVLLDQTKEAVTQ